MMYISSTLAALAFAGTVSAHTRMCNVWVNGVDQGDGKSTYIRSPPTNDPVKDLTSPSLVCNIAPAAVSDFVSAAAGDTLTFEWYHDTRGDDIIASSHEGPIITYIAPYTTEDGTGAIWTKIAEEGYDGTTWAVDNLIANKGMKDFDVPSTLAAGKYLIRQEIIALHEADASYADNSARGAQFYPSCVQVEITGSGTATPDEDFDFNTGYTETDPGIVFNLYGSFTSYTIPGPDVWPGSGSSSGGSSSSAASSAAASTSAAASSAATSAAASTSVAAVDTSSSSAVATSAASSYAVTSTTPSTTLATSTKAASTSSSAAVVTGPTTLATSVAATSASSASSVASTSSTSAAAVSTGSSSCGSGRPHRHYRHHPN